MFTKNLVVLLLLALTAYTAHITIGHYDDKTKTWRGYNPACDDQCHVAKGDICGVNVRSCCAKDQCQNKYGFNLCKTPLAGWACDQGLKKRKLDKYLNDNGV